MRPLVVDTVSVEHVHLPDRAALRLLDRLDTFVGTGRRQVLLQGDDPLAARAATLLARRALAGGEPPVLCLGAELRARLALEEPWLETHVPPGDHAPDVVVVCAGAAGDAAGLARGLRLATLHPRAKVVVTVEHESASDLL